MHDCYIRVIALLEYFEWTSSKQHNRSKGVVFLCLFFIHASSSTFNANQLFRQNH